MLASRLRRVRLTSASLGLPGVSHLEDQRLVAVFSHRGLQVCHHALGRLEQVLHTAAHGGEAVVVCCRQQAHPASQALKLKAVPSD